MDETIRDTLDKLLNPAANRPAEPEAEPQPQRYEGAYGNVLDKLLQPDVYNKELAAAGRRTTGEESTSDYIGRRSIPFVSSLVNWGETKNYGASVERFKAGNPTKDDIRTIADYEARQQHEHEKGLGASVGSAVAGIPALLGEFAVGGTAVKAVGKGVGLLGAAEAAAPSLLKRGLTNAAIGAASTPLVPSTYLAQGAANQNANPSESVFQSYAPALGLAAAQNAILGQLQSGLNSVPTRLGRIGAKTAVGMAEAAAADVATTGLDRVSKAVTGYSLGFDTKWGTLGAVLRGDEGSMKAAAVQAVTFSVFSAMHSGWQPSEKAIREFVKATDALHAEGMTKEEAGQELQNRGELMADLLKADPKAEPTYDLAKLKDLRERIDALQKGVAESNVADAEALAQRKPHETQQTVERDTVSSGSLDPVKVVGEDAVRWVAGDYARLDVRSNTHIERVLQAIDASPVAKAKLNYLMEQEVAKRRLASQRDLPVAPPELMGMDQPVFGRKFAPESPPAASPVSPAEVPVVPPIVPARGTPENATAKSALLERHRASQAAKGLIPAPLVATMGPRRPVANPTPAGERLRSIIATANEWAGKLAITPKEVQTLQHIIEGRTLEAVGLAEGVSKQAIDKRLRSIAAKLGIEHPELRRHIDGIIARYAVEEVSAGKRETFGDDVNPDAARAFTKRKIDRIDSLQKQIAALGDQFLKENEDAGRNLSSERKRWFHEQGTALAEALDRAQHGVASAEEAAESRPVEAPEAKPAEAGKPTLLDAAEGVNDSDRQQFAAEDAAREAARLAAKPDDTVSRPSPAKKTPLDKRLQSHLEGGTEFQKAEAEARLGGTKTMAQEVIDRGGINPNSFSDAEKQMLAEHFGVKRWQDVPIFRNSKGQIGGRWNQQHIDTLAEEMQDAGLIPRDASKHAPEQLMDMILNHSPVDAGEAHMEAKLNEHYAKEQAAEQERRDSMSPEERDAEDQAKRDAKDRQADMGHDDLGDEFGNDDFNFDDHFDAAGAPRADKMTAREQAEHVVDEMIVGHDPNQAPGMGAMSAHNPAPPNTPAGQIQAKAASIAQAAYSHVMGMAKSVADNWHELAGQIAPRLARMSEAAANAVAKLIAAPVYVERAIPKFVKDVLGPITGHEGFEGIKGEASQKDKDAVGMWFMATAHEERFRHQRKNLIADFHKFNELAKREADPVKRAEYGNMAIQARMAAEKVRTFIGRENAQLENEAKYQKTLAMPEYKAFKERWQKFAQVAEQFYKKAEGYEPDDALEMRSQLPDFTFTAKAIRESDTVSPEFVVKGEVPTLTGGGTRGQVTNVRQGKIGAAHEFTGSAEGYDIRPDAVMENMLRDRVGKAMKADLFRTLHREGLAQWAPKKQSLVLPDGRRLVELPVEAIKGTQEAKAGSSLYVHPDALKDVTRALGLNEPFKKVPGSGLATKLSLLSLVEFATHGRNIATFIFKPGVSPIDIAKNAWGLMKDNPEVRQKLVDLAEIGGVKPKGSETGNLWGGKYDPTFWMSKGLDLIDTTMRLTAADAFDRMVRTRGLKASEFNKRNFVNQIGQYIKKGQNDIVSLFRDTGLGPFATAGTNYTVQGIRALFGDTGLKAPDLKTAALLRAEFFARVAVPFIVAGVANALLHKRPDGDDNTPIGGLKIGNDANGKTMYLDLGGMTGLPRGARTLGLLALLEGKRSGVGSNVIANRAARDVAGGLAHPFEGPAVSFVHGVATGENTIGMPISRKAGEGENQKLLDLQGALANSNPAYAAISGANRPKAEVGIGEKAAGFLGPAAPKFRGSPPGGSLVDEVYDRFHALENDRKRATAAGQRFEGEVKYRQLDQATARLSLIRKRIAVSSAAEKEKLGELMKQTAEAALSR